MELKGIIIEDHEKKKVTNCGQRHITKKQG